MRKHVFKFFREIRNEGPAIVAQILTTEGKILSTAKCILHFDENVDDQTRSAIETCLAAAAKQAAEDWEVRFGGGQALP